MSRTDPLGPITPSRRTGDERFHDQGSPLAFKVLAFWRWSASDLVSNATRGIVAEFLVAQAFGAASGVREEWAAYDLVTPEGTRVEVKSGGFVRSWYQKRLSPIRFVVPKTLAWDPKTNQMDDEKRRQADVYVFAVLAHTEQATIAPLDVSQWEFYAVPTAWLDARTRSQHSITLPSLRRLAGEPVVYAGLPAAVEDAARVQRESAGGTGGDGPGPSGG